MSRALGRVSSREGFAGTLVGGGYMSRPRKIAVFPGQFDPITNGHLDVIRRGVGLFDELIVAVGVNPDKRELFTVDERVEMIGLLLKEVEGSVSVEKYGGLTVDFV